MHLIGHCHALFAFEVGRETDLAKAAQRLSSGPPAKAFRRKHRPLARDDRAAPLRATRPEEPEHVGEWATTPAVDVAVYPFGVVCVTWRIPFDSTLESLIGLSSGLYSNRGLIERSRAVCAGVMEVLGDAVIGSRLAEDVEDYATFHVSDVRGGPRDFWVESRSDVARLLRAEEGRLSEEETRNALGCATSFADDEACFVDWLSALLVGADMEDERVVLESLNVELLELRFLDAQVAQDVDQAYATLGRDRVGLRSLAPRSGALERIARQQVDNAVLHQGFDNALRLAGDDYLARLYRAAAERFHFSEWDAAIEAKLAVLDGIYRQLSDHASRRRAELLEWIIIVLIAIDIVLYFTPLR